MGRWAFVLPSTSGLPRVYWYVWTGALINRLGGFVLPFLALYLTRERGLSPTDAGLIVSLYGGGSLAAGPAGGWLADRVGRRATMAGGLALGAVAMLHLGYARHPVHIGVAAFLLGLLGDLFRPGVSAFIADVVPPEARQRAFAMLHWAINIGFATATFLGGRWAKNGFLALFWADALTTLVFAGVVLLRVPETRPVRDASEASADRGTQRTESRWQTLTVPLGDQVFVAFVLCNLVVSTIFLQSMVALPLDMRAHGVDAELFGSLIAINGLLIVLVQPYAPTLTQRLSVTQVLVVGAVLTGVGFGANALAASWPLYALAIVIWTLGEIANAPVGLSVVSSIAPPSLRGSYMGFYQMSWGGAQLVAPALGGWVMNRAGARTLWIGCLTAALLVAAAHLALAGARARRITRAAAERDEAPDRQDLVAGG